MDPFAVFGVAPSLDLDPAALEARYFELSRASHPDHHAAADVAAQTALLSRAAAVNDAYRALRDPWRRAEALLALHAPDELAATKALSPAFLSQALELAEEVAGTRPSTAAAASLAARLRAAVQTDWEAVRAAAAAGDWRAAAVRLHESRYHRKALEDLGR
jgi:molecular chaperone HscB